MKARLVRLPKPKAVDDSRVVRTLRYLLERARAGKPVGFAIVYIVDDGKTMTAVEGSDVTNSGDAHAMLGYIERMKAAFMARHWPNDHDADPMEG